jgi:hypothetical protein
MERKMANIVKPELSYIPVKYLSVVWVQAQRPYQERWAKEIADNLDPDKFDPIVVTKPNGQGIYHIIEGQHRRHALEIYAARLSKTGDGSNEQAPCRVVNEADPARAAEIWLGINEGRKSVKPIHGFKVAVIANREPEVAINKIVSQCGYRISAEKQQNCLAAVSALKIVYNRSDRATLAAILRLIRVVWDGVPNAVSSPMLRGFGIFVNEFGPHIDPKRLKAKLDRKWTPYKLQAAAEVRKQSSQERLDEAIAELLLREYNHGIKPADKLKHKG